jgi:hypothetical protein
MARRKPTTPVRQLAQEVPFRERLAQVYRIVRTVGPEPFFASVERVPARYRNGEPWPDHWNYYLLADTERIATRLPLPISPMPLRIGIEFHVAGGERDYRFFLRLAPDHLPESALREVRYGDRCRVHSSYPVYTAIFAAAIEDAFVRTTGWPSNAKNGYLISDWLPPRPFRAGKYTTTWIERDVAPDHDFDQLLSHLDRTLVQYTAAPGVKPADAFFDTPLPARNH